MEQIEKNNVDAKHQLTTNTSVFWENKEGKGCRILFVGNSMTLHGYKPEIGWHGEDYGMAASAKEKDYVHLVMKEIRKTDADAVMCIAQIADWETNYRNGHQLLEEQYIQARDFGADVVIIRLIENVRIASDNRELFYREYDHLIDFFNPSGQAKIILTTGFWKHPADECIMEIGVQRGIPVGYLGELGEEDSMKAIGLFEHTGVANHPGDQGMKAIADIILSVL